jgi:putative ABC transport system permease protein
VSEIAVRLSNLGRINVVAQALAAELSTISDKQGMRMLDVHTWQRLSPFANVANMIDMMTLFVRVMLIAIVLVSVMNVMIMAVYERIREIGTIAAIGTRPGRILGLFLSEGLFLGALGSLAGILVSIATLAWLNAAGLTFDFGQQQDLPLAGSVSARDVATVGLLVVAVAVVASLHPAWKASRMNPITALRHV